MNPNDVNPCRHSQFVTILPMTEKEYKINEESLEIEYCFKDSLFGQLLIASTPKGICKLSFEEDKESALNDLYSYFPHASYKETENEQHQKALTFFNILKYTPQHITLHVKGTEFQHQVWKALMEIPVSTVTNYGHIAQTLKNPNAARAVGSAIGKNPIAFIIPCHRVITSSNSLGGYRWGMSRKMKMLQWEKATV